jgi:hypothetical protein
MPRAARDAARHAIRAHLGLLCGVRAYSAADTVGRFIRLRSTHSSEAGWFGYSASVHEVGAPRKRPRMRCRASSREGAVFMRPAMPPQFSPCDHSCVPRQWRGYDGCSPRVHARSPRSSLWPRADREWCALSRLVLLRSSHDRRDLVRSRVRRRDRVSRGRLPCARSTSWTTETVTAGAWTPLTASRKREDEDAWRDRVARASRRGTLLAARTSFQGRPSTLFVMRKIQISSYSETAGQSLGVLDFGADQQRTQLLNLVR